MKKSSCFSVCFLISGDIISHAFLDESSNTVWVFYWQICKIKMQNRKWTCNWMYVLIFSYLMCTCTRSSEIGYPTFFPKHLHFILYVLIIPNVIWIAAKDIKIYVGFLDRYLLPIPNTINFCIVALFNLPIPSPSLMRIELEQNSTRTSLL